MCSTDRFCILSRGRLIWREGIILCMVVNYHHAQSNTTVNIEFSLLQNEVKELQWNSKFPDPPVSGIISLSKKMRETPELTEPSQLRPQCTTLEPIDRIWKLNVNRSTHTCECQVWSIQRVFLSEIALRPNFWLLWVCLSQHTCICRVPLCVCMFVCLCVCSRTWEIESEVSLARFLSGNHALSY